MRVCVSEGVCVYVCVCVFCVAVRSGVYSYLMYIWLAVARDRTKKEKRPGPGAGRAQGQARQRTAFRTAFGVHRHESAGGRRSKSSRRRRSPGVRGPPDGTAHTAGACFTPLACSRIAAVRRSPSGILRKRPSSIPHNCRMKLLVETPHPYDPRPATYIAW